jgi:sodium transport system permease protein
VVALLGFYGGRVLQLSLGEAGLLATQLLLLGLPALLFVRLGPFEPRRALALRRPSGRSLLAALLIAAGGLPIGWLLGWLQSFVFELPQELVSAFEGLLRADDPLRLAWLILLVAVTPAICEELVFRGVLLQGLSRRFPMWRSIAFSALIFGAFHLSSATVIRFLPTAWIGLLLGYVVWHSRSIFPGMLMHFVNNATAVVLVSSPTLQGVVTGEGGRPQWPLLALAVLLLAAGIRLLPRRRPEPAPGEVGGRVLGPTPVLES